MTENERAVASRQSVQWRAAPVLRFSNLNGRSDMNNGSLVSLMMFRKRIDWRNRSARGARRFAGDRAR